MEGVNQEYLDELKQKVHAKVENVDLSIEFCGVRCENPFFLSSSIVGSNYEMIAKAFDMGWAGVAFKTIGNSIYIRTALSLKIYGYLTRS